MRHCRYVYRTIPAIPMPGFFRIYKAKYKLFNLNFTFSKHNVSY